MWRQSEPKILLVEDDDTLKDILSHILSELGFEVIPASNGQMALDVLRTQTFSLIISDIQMPELDGVVMLEEIKKRGLRTPVILMTGFSDFLNVNFERRGAAALLEKPFNKSRIENMLRPYLKQKTAAA